MCQLYPAVVNSHGTMYWRSFTALCSGNTCVTHSHRYLFCYLHERRTVVIVHSVCHWVIQSFCFFLVELLKHYGCIFWTFRKGYTLLWGTIHYILGCYFDPHSEIFINTCWHHCRVLAVEILYRVWWWMRRRMDIIFWLPFCALTTLFDWQKGIWPLISKDYVPEQMDEKIRGRRGLPGKLLSKWCLDIHVVALLWKFELSWVLSCLIASIILHWLITWNCLVGVLYLKGVSGDVTELIVSNLPVCNGNGNNRVQIRTRLMQLGYNCRGRVVRIMHDGRALLRFPNREAMLRSVVVILNVATDPGNFLNFKIVFSRPGQFWNMV